MNKGVVLVGPPDTLVPTVLPVSLYIWKAYILPSHLKQRKLTLVACKGETSSIQRPIIFFSLNLQWSSKEGVTVYREEGPFPAEQQRGLCWVGFAWMELDGDQNS